MPDTSKAWGRGAGAGSLQHSQLALLVAFRASWRSEAGKGGSADIRGAVCTAMDSAR